MSNANETMADIVREMRERFKPYARSESNDARYTAYMGYSEFADRIEAAVRRIRSRCYAALDGEYDCAHGYEIREAFKGEVNDGV